jgi:hypothetical protein
MLWAFRTRRAWWKTFAIETLVTKYPPEVVSVYLNAFNDMNEANWPNLKSMLENDARLQLGAH